MEPGQQDGDYVVCRRPIEGWYKPYEHIMSFEYGISFSNGHMLYILTQGGNSRGPNADYNITDEALTLDKEKFDPGGGADPTGVMNTSLAASPRIPF